MSSNLPPKSHDEYNKLKQMAINQHESRHREQIKERMKSIRASFINALTILGQDNNLSVPNYPEELIQTSLQYIRNEWKGPTLNQKQLDDEKKMNDKYFKDNIGNWICRHAKDISYPCILKYIQILRKRLIQICQNDDKAFRCIWYNFWKQILDANINCNNTKLEVIPGGLLSKYKDIRDELQRHLFQKFSGYIVNLENMNNCKTTKEYKIKIQEEVHKLSTQFTTNYQPPIQHPTETKSDDNPPQIPTITNQFRSNSTAAFEPHTTPNTTDVVHTTTHLTPVVINNHQSSNFTHYRNDGVSHSSNVVINRTQSAAYIQHEQKIPIQSQMIIQPSETSAMFYRHNNHHDTSNHPIEAPYICHMNNTQRSQDIAWSNSNNAAHLNGFHRNGDIFDEKENVPSHSTNPHRFRSEIAEQQPIQPQHLCNNTHIRPTIRRNHSYNNTLMTNSNDNAFYSSSIGVDQPQSRQYIQDITEQKIPAQSERITQYVQQQPVITTTTYPHNNHYQLMTDTTWSNNFDHFNASIDRNFNECRYEDPSMPEIAEQQHTQQPTGGVILDSNISQIQHSYDYMYPSNFASTENTPSQIPHLYQNPPIGYNPSHNASYTTSYSRYNPY